MFCDIGHIFALLLSVGKSKCMMKTGDCVIKHPGVFTTGLKLVVSYTSHHWIFLGSNSNMSVWCTHLLICLHNLETSVRLLLLLLPAETIAVLFTASSKTC